MITVHKLNSPIHVSYQAVGAESNISDMTMDVFDINGNSMSGFPVIMTGIGNGLYESSFTPSSVGIWRTKITSSSAPENGQEAYYEVTIIGNLNTSTVQNVKVSNYNNSISNLASGASFIGTGETTLGVVGIQINFKADKNCRVYVQQSNDNVNWDVEDLWDVQANEGSSRTFQATASYFRTIVSNTDATTSTFLRLQSVLCPIVEALPRALSYDGRLKVEATVGASSLSLPIQVKHEKPFQAINANEWQDVASYIVPTGYRFTVNSFRCHSETAGESSRVFVEVNAGTFVCSTDTFTDGGAFVFPQFGSGLYLKVTTAIGSTLADTVTITYTNELGTTGRTCTIVAPKNSLVGTSIEGELEGDDLGIRDITNITHSATGQAGEFKVDMYYNVFDILMTSANNMYQALSISGQPVTLTAGAEIVMGVLAGTKTSYTRHLSLTGTLDPI